MAKGNQAVLEVKCPCCDTAMRVDPDTGAVLSHKTPEKPKPIEDLAAAVAGLKGAAAQREDAFQKSFEAHRSQKSILNKKFDELLKQAKENPDTGPPKRDIDL